MRVFSILFAVVLFAQGVAQQERELERLVLELSDEDPDVRDRAETSIRALAPANIQALKDLLQKGNLAVEAHTRLEKIIKQCEDEKELNESLPEMKRASFQVSDESFKNVADKLNKTFGTAVSFTFEGIGDAMKVTADCKGNFYEALDSICKATGKASFYCEANDKITIAPVSDFKPSHANTAYGRIELRHLSDTRDLNAKEKKRTAEITICFFRPDATDKILSARYEIKGAKSPEGEVKVLKETDDNVNNLVKIAGGGKVVIRGAAVRGFGFQQNELKFDETINLEIPWSASSFEIQFTAKISVKLGEKTIEINMENTPSQTESNGVVYSFDKNSNMLQVRSDDKSRNVNGLVDESSIVYVNAVGEEKKFQYVSPMAMDWGDSSDDSLTSYMCVAAPATEIRKAKSVKLKTRTVRDRVTENLKISIQLAGK